MDPSLGTRLRRLREQRGLTQARLAKLSRTTQQHVSLLERDASGVELGTLRKLLEALGHEITFTPRPAAGPLAKRLRDWSRFEARAEELEASPQSAALSLAQAGELAEFFLSRHGREVSSGGLREQARRISAWRGLLSRVRIPAR
ncbi:MAG: helix-turn-helix transcriptional regulator [Elusimicrobia bacterium]|nr:helix-turn-helix transcriptional regulator [Elusimicrobiota bacterium]